MKKLILILSIALCSFTSCFFPQESYVTTQDDIYVETSANIVRSSNIDFNIIIRYGTPYYYEGNILYYLYNGIYYYPFYYNNYWYVRAYNRPFTYIDRRPYFRPNRHDYRFSPGTYRGFDRPRSPRYYNPRPNFNREPQRRPEQRSNFNREPQRRIEQRPNSSIIRPNQPSNNRMQRPSGSFTTPRTTSPSRGGNTRGGFGGRRR